MCFVVWAAILAVGRIKVECEDNIVILLKKQVGCMLSKEDKILVHERVVSAEFHFRDPRLLWEQCQYAHLKANVGAKGQAQAAHKMRSMRRLGLSSDRRERP